MAHLPASSFLSYPKKDICLSIKLHDYPGLVQQPDKIVVRFAHTIYPYSLDKKPKARKKSEPVFVDGHGRQIVDNTSKPVSGTRFELSDHLCLVCLGRLLRRRLPGRKPRYELVCSNCQDTHIVEGEEKIPCWCHKQVGSHGEIFECFHNPAPCTQIPNVILVREKPVVMSVPQRMYRPVFSELQDYL